MQLRQLTILGVGLLGGSIGLAMRSAAPRCRIIGWGHRVQSLQLARQMGAIDQAETDPAAAVADSDMVILCTPVGTFETILRQISASLPRRCLLTDVGSTKRSIVRLAGSILDKKANFVASHPIAGSDKRGVEFARADLFKNNLCIVTPTSTTPAAALKAIGSFWQMLGMRLAQLSPEEHDRLLADVSHLPHLLAAALVAMQDEPALQLCGQGFLDATRIAGGDGGLWRDILLDNADNLRGGMARFQAEISRVTNMLAAGEQDALRQWLTNAAQRRQKLMDRMLREMRSD